MTKELYTMLKKSAEADQAKAKLSLDLLGNHAVGIGDHSTEDFYKNASEALAMLTDGKDKLETLEAWWKDQPPYLQPLHEAKDNSNL